MRRHTKRRAKSARPLALLLAVILCIGGAVAWGLSRFVGEDAIRIREGGETDGLLRVSLRSLGAPKTMTLTLDGIYAVENDPGFRFARGAQVYIWEDTGELWLTCGDLTINMGGSFTLTRHAAAKGEPNGLYIAESAQNNLYTGELQVSANGGAISALLYIDVEDYLYGVVPYEMSDSWPLEALKAQAIAARTYALGRKAARAGQEYDLVDTTADQVFKGFNGEMRNAINAVDSTRGIVGMYKGAFATCYYGASNGGQTALPAEVWGREGDYGYLDVRDDPYDVENPYSVLRLMEIFADGALIDSELASLLKAGLSEQLASMGFSEDAEDIRISRVLSISPGSPKGGEQSRMYQSLAFTLSVEGRKWGEPTATPAAGEGLALREFERIESPVTVELSTYGQIKPTFEEMSINGADCELYTVVAVLEDGTEEPVPSAARATDTLSEPIGTREPSASPVASFRIEARRFGHGVGMSQRGAQMMAGQHGCSYTDILLFYYPGMDLVRYTMAKNPLSVLDELPEGPGAERVRKASATPAPLPPLETGERYAEVVLSSDSSSLNVRSEPNTASDIVSALVNRQRVIVVEEFVDWCLIRTAETKGYVSLDYLLMEE